MFVADGLVRDSEILSKSDFMSVYVCSEASIKDTS